MKKCNPLKVMFDDIKELLGLLVFILIVLAHIFLVLGFGVHFVNANDKFALLCYNIGKFYLPVIISIGLYFWYKDASKRCI